MARLSRYLTAQFLAQALTIFLAGGTLIWLMQLLRLFDLVSAQGQNFLTLMGQSALTTPTFARAILYVCFAVGLARALRALATSRELHTIHAAGRIRALWGAIALFSLLGTAVVTINTHWAEPHARRISAQWSAEIAADVVGHALVPGRFTEVQPGLVFFISDRHADGTMVDFFFDDTTDDTRRSYFAREAAIFQDDSGYQLVLDEGSIQYEDPGPAGLSQILFTQYHISLASLLEATSPELGFRMTDSFTLVARVLDGTATEAEIERLTERAADTARSLALCALAAALCAFPSGARGQRFVPIELAIVLVAFAEQAVSGFSGGGAMSFIGPMVLLAGALATIGMRASRAFVLPRFSRGAA